MRAMMDDCKANPEKYAMPYFGVNEDDESVTLEVYKDRIILYTAQKNDWVRQNVYWYDGTAEELYSGEKIRKKLEEQGSICPCCGQYIPLRLRKTKT